MSLMRRMVLVWCVAGMVMGCAPKINLFEGGSEPLREYTLQGGGEDRVLLMHVAGVIDNDPQREEFGFRPSLVQEVVSRLDMAAEDDRVKALVLSIDSPGGSVTASDVLYQEIVRFKKRTGCKAVALLMDVAASGGYYAAAASDRIVAHPTTLTGSIGTVFIRPDVSGLMGKIGIGAEVTKSGQFKDMGSPFRESTAEERELLQEMIRQNNQRFLDVVRTSRALSAGQLARVADARVFTADQAKECGLVDRIGYLEDALAEARMLAGLGEDARMVVYRRAEFPNDTAYNTLSARVGGPGPLFDLGLSRFLVAPRTGFYYLWAPEYAAR